MFGLKLYMYMYVCAYRRKREREREREDHRKYALERGIDFLSIERSHSDGGCLGE